MDFSLLLAAKPFYGSKMYYVMMFVVFGGAFVALMIYKRRR